MALQCIQIRCKEPTFSVRAFREVKGFQGRIAVIARGWALPILGPVRMHHLTQMEDRLPRSSGVAPQISVQELRPMRHSALAPARMSGPSGV